MHDRLPLLSVVLVLLMAGCASSSHKAPVEDRAAPARPVGAMMPAAPASPAAADARPLPNAEHAGKPGYYTVKPGDTLIRVGLENGQNWRDVARWNSIENPNLIEVGQVLRVVPPGMDAAAVATRGVGAARAEPRPLDAKPPAAPASAASTASGQAVATAPASPASAPAAVASAAAVPAAPRDAEDDVNWLWPASGQVAAGFEEGRSKGLAILGKAGDPVLAAADGRVVYAGSGLRGYGNLVIVKHNNTYLTAYAHNQTLLVKEDQVVRRGQRIAEMGSSDADRVQLHFEIRRQGKPIDPSRLLPPR
ncbi:MAG: peptidoglycan DD-metalloendopeptidase family protein [Burkholderiales bacterium]|nr:peptidoglycan DD-metalloendopeptidase family protein [Burkholderiales bacterium]